MNLLTHPSIYQWSSILSYLLSDTYSVPFNYNFNQTNQKTNVTNTNWGSFGKVNLVKSKITKKYYAMKELKKLTPKNIKSIEKEIKLLESLHHPNTINYQR